MKKKKKDSDNLNKPQFSTKMRLKPTREEKKQVRILTELKLPNHL